MSEPVAVTRALLSVSDKHDLVPFARGLQEAGVELVSTGSTAEILQVEGITVTPVASVTGVPEMMDGRVKTLHPAIHGGILADRGNPGHREDMERNAIHPIDLVVVNLYPFEATAAAGGSREEVVEQIDIGGPALIRAAAKNFAWVGVVVSPDRYEEVLAAVREGGLPDDLRASLASEAFGHVAAYDAAIADWFEGWAGPEGLPRHLALGLEMAASLRYGENPHQRAALYRRVLTAGPLGGAAVLQGKEMSFNNWLDAEAARSLAGALPAPAAVIVKHNNPCGAAVAADLESAYRAAVASDPVSAFGGVVAFNVEVDEATARAMADVFTEVVVAPGFGDPALAAFSDKENLRVLAAPLPGPAGPEIRAVEGGALVQEGDLATWAREDMKVVTTREPSDSEWDDLLFAWVVAARVKSNAIVLARGQATVGVGAGQMSRVDSVDIAARKAGDRSGGAVMASDAFFPFRDGIDLAAEAGVTAAIQPGGSVRDEEVVAAAEEHGMAMVLTGKRHFRH